MTKKWHKKNYQKDKRKKAKANQKLTVKKRKKDDNEKKFKKLEQKY